MFTSDRASPMFDAADEEVARYRALSSLALAGLLAGLLSPLAMLSPVLWLAPLAAVVLSGLALRQIAVRSPELVGRPAALVGLVLGVSMLVAAPANDFVYRYLLGRQARQFAMMWIDDVRRGEVYKAHQLMLAPKQRLTSPDKLGEYYRKTETMREGLFHAVNEPALRTLFALGTAAEIRFYETAAVFHQEPAEVVEQTYAVTYPDERQRPKTFFITLVMQRSIESSSHRVAWTMARVDGGVRPAGW